MLRPYAIGWTVGTVDEALHGLLGRLFAIGTVSLRWLRYSYFGFCGSRAWI
jgi:hypothetical protein